VERRVRAASTAILVLLHHLLAATHFVPPDRQPTIRRERREQRTEHFPEQTLSIVQPQAPVVEQAPPELLPFAGRPRRIMRRLPSLVVQRRRTIIPPFPPNDPTNPTTEVNL
jgi:hypothetical protein